ncbi:cytochrome P450 [Streptomyces sp. NBC_01296]|uniref:cytochrome P450 n=1 Tax=Streptomyces sp. NBC_01296 TaxID=2903816 RepID=UPI002E14320E|nr:cytochrome P450 [Streptomyces sp. NBC_01296]
MITGQAETSEAYDVAHPSEGGLDIPRAPGHWGPLGHLPLLRHGLLSTLAELGAGAPVVKLQVGAVTKYVVSDGDLAQEILGDKRQAFGRKRVIRGFRPVTGDGLLSLESREHREHRRILAPAFGRLPLARITPLICEVASEYAGRMFSGPSSGPGLDLDLDLDLEMLRLSADITVRCLFRSHTDQETVSWLATKAAPLSKGVLLRMLAPAWSPALPTPEFVARRRATHRLRQVVADLPARHMPAEGGDDVLSLLEGAACPARGPARISRAAVVDELVTLLVAASEATAVTLAWAWHELARHPRAEQAVQAEADAVFNSGRSLPEKLLEHLPLTTKAVMEVLRLYPVPVLPRNALREVSVGGFRFPRGAEVLINVYGIHRDPGHYPQPHTFDPDRWPSDATPLALSSAYLPFSTGAHRCIGAPFAALIAPIALAALAARFQLRPAEAGRRVRAVPGVVTRPNRLIMTASPRVGAGIGAQRVSEQPPAT